MGLFSTIKAANYRAEGLNLMQALRIDASLAKNDFQRTVVIAVLAFMLVCSLSFIAMQSVNAPFPAPQERLETLPLAIEVEDQSSVLEIVTEAPKIETTTPSVPLLKASLMAQTAPQEIAQVAAAPIEIATPVAEKPAAPDCLVELRQLSQIATIHFDVGSAQLGGSDLVRLSQLGRMANACPEAKIQITGHSDTTGSDFINFDLSWKRADSTVNAIAQLGLNTAQFEPVGFGARTPLSQGDASDDDRNRRVEFVVLRNELDN